jgi:hypothetical protein
VVVVALVAGGVVAGCSPGAVLAGGSKPPPSPGTVEPVGVGRVCDGTAVVVAVGVSLPATMIDSPEPQAAAINVQASASEPARTRLIP